MDEDPDPPESEKPRFLLPDGCKDLIDALRKAKQTQWTVYPPSEEPAQALPASVTLPNPVLVRDLAFALRRKPYEVIHVLMKLNLFATLDTELDFATAASVCKHFGVAVHKAD